MKFKAYLTTGKVGKLNFVYARQYNLRQEFDKHISRNDSIAALNLPELQFEITTHISELVWKQNKNKANKENNKTHMALVLRWRSSREQKKLETHRILGSEVFRQKLNEVR